MRAQHSQLPGAVTDLESLLAAHPKARRIGIVLRNRPGPLAAVVAAIGTGRSVVTLSPHLGDIGLAKDIADLAPDVIVAESVTWEHDLHLYLRRAKVNEMLDGSAAEHYERLVSLLE